MKTAVKTTSSGALISSAPYLNLGCGAIILPRERPFHHLLLPEELYSYPAWVNVDRNDGPGVDETADLFLYPWPWPDNFFAGALLSHIVEHIPHAIRVLPNHTQALLNCGPYWATNVVAWRKRCDELAGLQDGWFAFFSELWRVLKPDAVAHVLVPHGHSDGGLADPTHTRYVLPHTFGYLEAEPDNATHHYQKGAIWQISSTSYRFTEIVADLAPVEGDDPQRVADKERRLQLAMMARLNTVYDFYVALVAVKDADHD